MSFKNDNTVFPIIPGFFIVGGLLITLIGGVVSCSRNNTDSKRMRQEAVERGYAEYVVDKESESVVFKWIEPKK